MHIDFVMCKKGIVTELNYTAKIHIKLFDSNLSQIQYMAENMSRELM